MTHGFQVYDSSGREKIGGSSNVYSLVSVSKVDAEGESHYEYPAGKRRITGVWVPEGTTMGLVDFGPDQKAGHPGLVTGTATHPNSGRLYSFGDLTETPATPIPPVSYGVQVWNTQGKLVFDPRRVPLSVDSPTILTVNRNGGYTNSWTGSQETVVGPAEVGGVPRCVVIPSIRSFYRMMWLLEPFELHIESYSTYVRRAGNTYYLGLSWEFTSQHQTGGQSYQSIMAYVLAGTMYDPVAGRPI